MRKRNQHKARLTAPHIAPDLLARYAELLELRALVKQLSAKARRKRPRRRSRT